MHLARRRPCARSRALRLAGAALATAVTLVATTPAWSQSAPVAPTPDGAVAGPPAPPAPALTVVTGAGIGSLGIAANLVGRYTFWLTPSFGLGPEGFTDFQALLGGGLETTGCNLSVAWRRPGRIADLVLRTGLGFAAYTRYPAGPFFPGPDYVPPPPARGVALTATAEASAVFHPWRALGVVIGGRAGLAGPGGGLGPYWNGEVMVGLSLTRPR